MAEINFGRRVLDKKPVVEFRVDGAEGLRKSDTRPFKDVVQSKVQKWMVMKLRQEQAEEEEESNYDTQ